MGCERSLGFDPESLELLTLEQRPDGSLQGADGAIFNYCLNQHLHRNCNWLLSSGGPGKLCLSCGLNEVIPELERADNLLLWTKVEKAKRRLLYSLLAQGLSPAGNQDATMRFRLLEDRNRNPNAYQSFVSTGHHQGTITINIAEADDVARFTIRQQMSETYRTVLGHLRHESGHFFFKQLTDDEESLQECRQVFGDERQDYPASLERYYQYGPPANWSQTFISAYAASHPAEDFAETFAHYLHIADALETAAEGGLGKLDAEDWLEEWAALAITLNEISRSLGQDDVYPFYLSPGVKDKLNLIRNLIRRSARH